MDGFTGFKTAAAEEIPAAVAVMTFHVVRLAGEALNDPNVLTGWASRGWVAIRFGKLYIHPDG